MSLQVWLPLNGDLKNQGLADITVTTSTSPVFKDYGKIGSKCLDLSTRIAFNCPALSGVTTFSVAFWVKLEDDSSITTNWQDIISFTDQKADNSGTGVLRAETCYGNTNYNGVHWHDNSGYCMSKSGETLPTHYSGDRSIWHHCVMTIDSNKEVKNYTDGVLLGTYVASGGGHLTGAFHLGENNLIVGGIADVRIWDEVISMKEVKQLSQGLVLHYKLSGIGGENLLNNESTNWGKYTCNSGVYNSSGSRFAPYQITIPIKPSASYTLSITDNLNLGEDFYCGVHQLDSEGTFKNDSGWKLVPYTFKSRDDAAFVRLVFRDGLNNGTNIQSYINAVGTTLLIKFEESERPTPYIPNSSDSKYEMLGFDDGIEHDCSGYGNDGTKIGDLQIDSDTARYVTSTYISHGANTRIVTPSLYFNKDVVTLNIWFKSTNKTPTNDYHMIVDSVANRQWYEICVNKNGYFRGGLFVNGTRYADNCTSTTALNGEWHMLTLVYDGTAVKRYFDGVMQKSSSVTATTGLSSPTAIVLGRDGPNATYACVEASLSDFRIYATALSADDILTLYNTAATIDNQGNLFTYEVVEG